MSRGIEGDEIEKRLMVLVGRFAFWEMQERMRLSGKLSGMENGGAAGVYVGIAGPGRSCVRSRPKARLGAKLCTRKARPSRDFKVPQSSLQSWQRLRPMAALQAPVFSRPGAPLSPSAPFGLAAAVLGNTSKSPASPWLCEI
jgi:hypothetical protein